MGNVVPKKLMEQIYADFGKDPRQWPEELRDIFDASIDAKQLNAPKSSSIKIVKNTNYHYHMAKDVMGANPDHTRVEELRAEGWEFATTDDVVMYNAFTVKNRKGGKDNGFSNEIRNGDLRLMKLPLTLWRQHRKSENVRAYQMAYPQIFGGQTGRPMTSEEFTPGLKSELLTGQDLAANEDRFRKENTDEMRKPQQEA